MNHRTNRSEDQFDTWLDAYVAGMSTPASRAASDSETSEVRAAARQFHGLAHGAERSPTLIPYVTTWEDFMHSESIGTAAELAPPVLSESPHRSRIVRPVAPHQPAWDRAFSAALVAAIVLALTTGFWRASDGFNNFGNGGDSGGNQHGAFAPDTRVWTPEASEATPEPAEERALLPTAEECTVEPLTVDDVLWYIDDPLGATVSRDMDQPATPKANTESDPLEPTVAPDGFIVDGELVWATPGLEQDLPPDPLLASPPPVFTPGPASAEQLAAVAEVQRMWMACVLADSTFQRWALESPLLVLEQVMPLIPIYSNQEKARQILEDVQVTGEMEPADDFWRQPGATYLGFPPDGSGFPTSDTISIIDPATADSWTLDGRTITSTYSSHHDLRNGEVSVFEWDLTVNRGTPIADANEERPVFDPCGSFEFTWFPERSQVLVSSIPTCG